MTGVDRCEVTSGVGGSIPPRTGLGVTTVVSPRRSPDPPYATYGKVSRTQTSHIVGGRGTGYLSLRWRVS